MAIPFTLSVGSASITATEFFLVSASTTATYQTTPGKASGFIDFSAMAAGDCYQVTPYDKVNGGSVLPAAPPSFPTGVQSSHFVIPERWMNEGWEIGVKLITGSARTIAWSVKLDVGDRNLSKWLGAVPAALTANGYVQAALLRWLTDDAGGTPSALSSNKVQVILSSLGAGSITAATFAANALGAVLDELLSAHTTAGTLGKVVGDNLNATVGSRAQPSDVPSAASIATQVWGTALEGTMTAADIMRGILSGVMGVVSGFISGLEVFKDITGTKTRWTVQTAADGRTSVVKGDLS